MSGVNFVYTASSNDTSDAYNKMRKKHVREAFEFDDNFYLTQIFKYVWDTYSSLTGADRRTLKHQTEEDITDCIRRKLQNNKNFGLDGFKVNTEARNQGKDIGYYDLKFENGLWLDQYLVLECKPMDDTQSKVDAYIYKNTPSRGEDGGLYRFLINKYATDKTWGGMLGYIISGNPNQIVSGLKSRIQTFQTTKGDLCFGNLQNQELLNQSIANFDYSFQSNHVRISGNQLITPIHIFHLFLDLTQ